jgi:hypothetical protein
MQWSNNSSVRRNYFLGSSGWVLAVMAISTTVLGMPLLHPLRIGQASLLAAAPLGVLSGNHRVHAGPVIFVFSWLALRMFAFGARPDSFTPQ